METREFINAWMGWIETKRQDYAVQFEVASMNAYYTSFSKEQQKAVKKMRNPYTDKKRKKGKPVTMDQVSGLLSAMAKSFNKDDTIN